MIQILREFLNLFRVQVLHLLRIPVLLLGCQLERLIFALQFLVVLDEHLQLLSQVACLVLLLVADLHGLHTCTVAGININ